MPDAHAFRHPPGGEPNPIELDREPAGDGPAAKIRPDDADPTETAWPGPDGRAETAWPGPDGRAETAWPGGIGEGGPVSEPDPAGGDASGRVPRQRGGAREPGRRPSRGRMVLLGSVLALGVAGAAVFGGAAWRVVQQKNATIRTPAEVAGLTLDDSEEAQATANYLRTGLAAGIRLDESVGAVYTDPAAADRKVLLFGGTTLIWQPERDLDPLFDLVADDESEVTGFREMPAGPLGGVLKCGTTATPDGDMAVCGWADHGSVALALFPGRAVDEAGALMREIREETQSRD